MAPKAETQTNIDFLDDNEEWETVVTESGLKLAFSNVGESFVGTYVGTQTIHNPKDDTDFDQQQFRDPEGTLYAINGGFKLREGLKDVAPGAIVRITYMGEIDTGSPSPMKDFRVESRRPKSESPTKEEPATEDIPF